MVFYLSLLDKGADAVGGISWYRHDDLSKLSALLRRSGRHRILETTQKSNQTTRVPSAGCLGRLLIEWQVRFIDETERDLCRHRQNAFARSPLPDGLVERTPAPHSRVTDVPLASIALPTPPAVATGDTKVAGIAPPASKSDPFN
ncbi:hypothetical protein DPEC_G00103140 [Dallia pectoralis]|uniref:Uncharacterized protein n=1 Tax=Dallia pectoralis TaxID=75939 RepID=A0ACC2GWX9_DALPE|nr:hypothetical protein DPEC_G00103140 [Dallia pectoralis]